MERKKFLLTIFTTALGALASKSALARERVAKVSNLPMDDGMLGGNVQFVTRPIINNRPNPNFNLGAALNRRMDDNSFEVYTSQEIDSINSDLKSSLNTSISGATDTKLAALEERLKLELKSSLDAIPQRLLSAEAKEAVKAAVLTDVSGELAQIRQDLQTQIDQINQRLDNLSPNPSP